MRLPTWASSSRDRFKATPHRVVGPDESVAIRADSTWSVPDPEMALILTPKLEIAGYSFPTGAILLTGTGIVPPDTFSLAGGDTVEITFEGLGTLSNPVVELLVGGSTP